MSIETGVLSLFLHANALTLNYSDLGRKKTRQFSNCSKGVFQTTPFSNHRNNYDWIRELSIAAPADPQYTIRAINTICFNFSIIKSIKNPQATLSNLVS